jgi:manganese-dependent inorganic pyrophosphatase
MQRKRVLVIGHRNPDTDSIVSALAYAELKRTLGYANCIAVRCGNMNPQTEYILGRFGLTPPEDVGDLIPRVRNHMSYGAVTVSRDMPLWHAVEILSKGNYKMLPIVDDEGGYLSVLHFNAFAQNMLQKIDLTRKGVFPTSVGHLIKTLNAQPITVYDETVQFQARIAVAAYAFEAFKEHLRAMPLSNTIVLVGDREDIQAHVIENGVRVVVVSGGKAVSGPVIEKARERGVSVLLSPFDTSTTSWLMLYSSPVEHAGDGTVMPLKENDYLGSVKDSVQKSASRSCPVIGAGKKVMGILSQSDLIREPDTEVIMVDHNEISQAAEGIEHYRILEIIDHHRLGNLHTAYPVTFINRPVGATSTIIASLYEEHRVAMLNGIASALLAGILSDTVVLRSATATETDRRTAEYLSAITGVALEDFGREILCAGSLVGRKPVDEILALDRKRFGDGRNAFTISQVEVTTIAEIMDRETELIEGLERQQEKTGNRFSALMVTDVTDLDSALFIAGDPVFISRLRFPKLDEGVFLMKGILSRKKQLVPTLTELLRTG